MSEKKPSKSDKVFRTILLLALNVVEVASYVGIVVVSVIAGYAFWKFGWKEFHQIFWPALGVFALLVGSILGAKYLRKIVV